MDDSADEDEDNILEDNRALTVVPSANRSNVVSDADSAADDEEQEAEKDDQNRNKLKKVKKSAKSGERGNKSGRGTRH